MYQWAWWYHHRHSLSVGFIGNLLYKCIGNTLTSAPVSSFTLSLSQLPLARMSVSHAEDFLIPSIWNGLKSKSPDDRYKLVVIVWSPCASWSVSCTSWSFLLGLVPDLKLWSHEFFWDLPLHLCLGKDVLFQHTLAKWCNLWHIEHFYPYVYFLAVECNELDRKKAPT